MLRSLISFYSLVRGIRGFLPLIPTHAARVGLRPTRLNVACIPYGKKTALCFKPCALSFLASYTFICFFCVMLFTAFLWPLKGLLKVVNDFFVFWVCSKGATTLVFICPFRLKFVYYVVCRTT